MFFSLTGHHTWDVKTRVVALRQLKLFNFLVQEGKLSQLHSKFLNLNFNFIRFCDKNATVPGQTVGSRAFILKDEFLRPSTS